MEKGYQPDQRGTPPCGPVVLRDGGRGRGWVQPANYHILAFLFAFLLTAGCTAPRSFQNEPAGSSGSNLRNAFTIPAQKAPPRHIQSIRLYRKGALSNPPVIRLGSGEKLVLEFDHIGNASRQFKAEITHRNRNWEESLLAPNFYLSGFNTIYFSGGLKSFSQRPSYFHHTFEFPNNRLSFAASGNYLLSVYEYDTNELLFALPFFVTEDEGILETRVETMFARREDLRQQDQPFSRYIYPDFVEFPQFDLFFQYVQNQFWGRAKEVEFFDTATPGQVRFHLGQDQAFIGNYEFNVLDLRSFDADGRQIVNIKEGTIPPTVILRRDVQNFSPSPRFAPGSRFGFPADERGASYADVQFRLETDARVDSTESIYLVGDFNNWAIHKKNRMVYDAGAGWWRGSAFIKEGEYAYKYVTVQDQRINDLALDQGFSFVRQEYITLVYFRDPARNFDRLLKVDRMISN